MKIALARFTVAKELKQFIMKTRKAGCEARFLVAT